MSDTWQSGDPYERYVGRWSRQVAPRFVAWLDLPAGGTVVDVGCGTGALCEAILGRAKPARVVGVEPSDGFRETAAARLGGRAELHAGNAQSIPLHDGEADAVLSALVLNFVPDPVAGVTEMARVARHEGIVAAYVWDYAGRMDLMRRFWDVAAELDPAAAKLDEGVRFPLCKPEALAALFARAGLRDIAQTSIDVDTTFADFDDYWLPFTGGQGPAPSYAMSLSQAGRDRLREHLRERLRPRPDGSIGLVARALAIRGHAAR
jgi:SAM-dependent methyltransferase